MSGWHRFTFFEPTLEANCPDYYSSWLAGLWIGMDFYPLFVTAGFWALNAYHREIYFFWMGVAGLTDWVVNYALQQWFRQLSPFPTCSNTFEMPSFTTEHATLTIMMLMALPVLWEFDPGAYRMLWLYGILAAALYSRVITSINTPWQMFAGALVGFLSALLWIAVIRNFLAPEFPRMLGWTFFRWQRMDNTLCRPLHEREREETRRIAFLTEESKKVDDKRTRELYRKYPDFAKLMKRLQREAAQDPSPAAASAMLGPGGGGGVEDIMTTPP